MAPATLISPALASLGDPRPRDGLLTTDELEQLAVDIFDRGDIWEPLVRTDAEQRRYELIYEDEQLDAWVLSWMPGQGTGFHDHYISGVGLCCAQGGVREDLLVYGGPDVELHLRPGDNGLVRREVRPGRNELTDQLVSEGALEHVLERF